MQRRRPALGATRRKTADNHDFLPAGNVFGSPRQLRHAASFCPRCPCSQSSPSISFSFFSLFFIGFPTAIAKEANVRNSHFLGDPGAKTVLKKNYSGAGHEASGMGCVLCITTLASLPAIFFPRLPSSFRMRRDFAREKLILSSVGTWR